MLGVCIISHLSILNSKCKKMHYLFFIAFQEVMSMGSVGKSLRGKMNMGGPLEEILQFLRGAPPSYQFVR